MRYTENLAHSFGLGTVIHAGKSCFSSEVMSVSELMGACCLVGTDATGVIFPTYAFRQIKCLLRMITLLNETFLFLRRLSECTRDRVVTFIVMQSNVKKSS